MYLEYFFFTKFIIYIHRIYISKLLINQVKVKRKSKIRELHFYLCFLVIDN